MVHLLSSALFRCVQLFLLNMCSIVVAISQLLGTALRCCSCWVVGLAVCLVFVAEPGAASEPKGASEPARISAIAKNTGQVSSIYLAPGLISVVEFSEPILDVKIGAPEKIRSLLSPMNPKELTLFLADPQPFQTNLIVRTSKRVFVFDLVPNLSKHQDYLLVRSGFGGPGVPMGSLEIQSISISPERVSPRRSMGRELMSGRIE